MVAHSVEFDEDPRTQYFLVTGLSIQLVLRFPVDGRVVLQSERGLIQAEFRPAIQQS